MKKKEFYSVDQLAKVLGRSWGWIRTHAKTIPPAWRAGKMKLYDVDALAKLARVSDRSKRRNGHAIKMASPKLAKLLGDMSIRLGHLETSVLQLKRDVEILEADKQNTPEKAARPTWQTGGQATQ
jgi:hypothetical protein